jgi:predicted ester cyclase/quinol monooxygenase YgiN
LIRRAAAGTIGQETFCVAIYTIAQYKVRPSGIETVKRAIQEFVPYVTAHEPGTRMYLAWQQQDDPARFVHFFIFENEAAHEAHSRSEAVKRFEAAYGPELDGGGGVVFTGYNLIATNQGSQEEKNKEVIREFTRIFKNEHNVDGVSHLFDKDFIHHFRTPMPAGFEGLRQVGIMMNGAFPDVVVTEEDLIAAGDRVVERSSAVATHKGSLMGAPPTDKRVHWTEIHIYRVQNGKICEHWAEIAMMELLQQTGGLPSVGEIKHSIQIAATPEQIYPLVATAKGFGQWWATDITEPAGVVDLAFFNRATVYRLRPIAAQPPTQAEWICETGDEWSGTRIAFELEAVKSGTVLRFKHAGWRAEGNYFVSCNTTWGELMFRLKDAAEGKARGPLFSREGMGD